MLSPKFFFIFALCSIFSHFCFGCGTEDCPVDCADKYKCVDRSESCAAMKGQCENFFFRKCMRCACPKTCGVCGDSSSESAERETTSPTPTSPSTSTIPPSSPTSTTGQSSTPSKSTKSSRLPFSSTPRIVFAANVTKRYPAAKIKYCNCNLWQFPEIEDFIHALEGKSGNGSEYAKQVSPQYVTGIHPTLVFLEANGTEAKSTPVGGWSIKKIKEYLDENLVQMAPKAGANGASKNGMKNGGGNGKKQNGIVVAKKLVQKQENENEEEEDEN